MAATESITQRLCRTLKVLESRKQNWNNLYQRLAEYCFYHKANFTVEHSPGEVQNAELYDTHAVRASRTLASFLRGMLWPNGARSFRIISADQENGMTFDVKKFFEKCTRRMAEIMDSPKSQLALALSEYLLDLVVFGTSGIAVQEKDDVVPVRYSAWDIKHMYVSENSDGQIDSIYRVKEFTAIELVELHGDNVSAKVKEAAANEDKESKFKVLWAIEPRRARDLRKRGSLDMPIMSIQMELGTNKILKESGFEEYPVMVSRFFKSMGEEYGRSPAMDALPDIQEINAIKEAITLAIEKQLDPPLAIMDDGRLGGGVIDTSPGALNVFNPSGQMAPDKVLFPIFAVGDIKPAEFLVEQLKESIDNAFSLDKLLDFNNEARMTLGEANMRNKIRGEALNEMFSRQEGECFTPLIERTFNILLSRGEFGVVRGSDMEKKMLAMGKRPDYLPEAVLKRMVEGKVLYNIEYISPAQRIRRSEELSGIMSIYQFAMENVQIAPEAADNFDTDEAIKVAAEIAGMPTRLFRDDDSKKQVRAAREQRQAQMAEAEALEKQTKLAAMGAQAQASMAQAQMAAQPRGVR